MPRQTIDRRIPGPGLFGRSRSYSARATLTIAGLLIVLLSGSVTAGGPAAVVYDGRADRPEIALTIDDGYDTGVCRQMLRTLRRRNVKATFFPIGKNVAAHPRFWRNVARDFPIANHTASHAILPRIGKKRIRRQIRGAERTIERVTGDPILKVLRPPGGAFSSRVRWVAWNQGYRTLLLWDTSAADTSLRSTPKGMLRAALRGTNGSVILMHCNRQVSADILPRIIRSYRQRGYRFVTAGHLLRRAGYRTSSP